MGPSDRPSGHTAFPTNFLGILRKGLCLVLTISRLQVLTSYTLRSVTMSGHVNYKRNSLAGKMQEDLVCNTGDSACSTHLPISLILAMAYLTGQWPISDMMHELLHPVSCMMPELVRMSSCVLGRAHELMLDALVDQKGLENKFKPFKPLSPFLKRFRKKLSFLSLLVH